MHAFFLAFMCVLGMLYFFDPSIKIQNKFEDTFKENTDFYILNDILTNKEKEKLIYSLNNNDNVEKERVFSLVKEEKKDEISKIGELGKEELKRNFEKEETHKKVLIGIATILTVLAAYGFSIRRPF